MVALVVPKWVRPCELHGVSRSEAAAVNRIRIDDLHWWDVPEDFGGEIEYTLVAFDGTSIRHHLRFCRGELMYDDRAVLAIPS